MTVPAPVAAVPSTRRTSAARRAGRALLATATAAALRVLADTLGVPFPVLG